MKYPIGIQDFERIIEDGYVYLDKTGLVYDLVHNGTIYFLCRPRRFGKSLLVSTLKCYFEGKKKLFKGLAIDKLEKEWKQYPVLHLSFGGQNFVEPYALDKVLEEFVAMAERIYGREELAETLGSRFKAVLGKAHQKTGMRAVVLIDEYDKPLLDVMDMDMDEVMELVDKPVIYSDKFKKWFGDWENDPKHSSKMIGMSGRPKVFYHGTDKDFSIFSQDKIGSNTGELGWYGKGFYFASDYLQAGHYGKNILEVYLNIRNPFYIDAEHLMKYRDELGLTEEELRNSDPARFLKNNRLSMKLSNLLEKDGYDGIVYSEDGVSFNEVIAFHPNQIKSAEDNKEYNPESENIYEASEDRAIYTWEFKRWFGDWEGDPEHSSKMVDKEGKPLVCFHGSHDKFNTFETKYHWNDEGYFGKGYYFTFNENTEGAEAEARYYGPNIYKCYLNVRNPFDFSQLYMTEDGGKGDVAFALYNLYRMFPEMSSRIEITHDGKEISLKQYAELYENVESRMYLDQMVDGKYVWRLKLDHEPKNEFEEDSYSWMRYDTEDEAKKRKTEELQMFLIHKENVYLYQFPYYITQDSGLFSELVRKKGYDGVIQSKYGDEVLVFESEQIKSVDNKGSFDPESKNIYERIIRKDGKWMVTDHTGKMNLGTYDTKEEAEERLKQVEAFKHMSEHFISGIADLLDF